MMASCTAVSAVDPSMHTTCVPTPTTAATSPQKSVLLASSALATTVPLVLNDTCVLNAAGHSPLASCPVCADTRVGATITNAKHFCSPSARSSLVTKGSVT